MTAPGKQRLWIGVGKMDSIKVLAEIKSGRFQPVYLLHGEEPYLSRQLEKALVDALLAPDERAMNLIIFERDVSTAQLSASIETVPFMGGKNVVISRGTNLFKARRKNEDEDGEEGEAKEDHAVDERLLALLANMPDYSHLILITHEKADKRRKIYKVVEQNGVAVELAPLKAKDARPWLVERLTSMGRKMAPDALEYILTAVSMMPKISLDFLEQELDKVALYVAKDPITRKDLQEIMATVPEVSVFAMVEAVSQKKVGNALKLLEEQFTAGGHAVRLLALLTRQVRMLLQSQQLAEQGLAASQIAVQLHLHPFIAEKLVRQSQSFSAVRLRETVVLLAQADWDLKSGRADKSVLEEIIIQMCG